MSTRKAFPNFTDLGALQVPQFHGDHLDGVAQTRACRDEVGVAVSRNDLRGRNGSEAQLLPNLLLDSWVDVGEGADRTGQLAHRDRVSACTHTGSVAIQLQCPQGQLCAERGRFGMHAMRPPHHHGVPMFDRSSCCRANQVIEGADDQIGRVAQHPAPGGVDHVTRRETMMNPRTVGLADRGLHHVDECGHVVISDRFALDNAVHESFVHSWCLLPACLGRVFRNHAEARLRLGSKQFDLQVTGELPGVREDRLHLRRCVAVDHVRTTQSSRSGPTPMIVTGTPTCRSTSSTTCRAPSGSSS